MATSLLATKLFVPPARPGLVSRPRLMERMRAALNYGLTLISAPAGSGKTTLISDWVRHIKGDIPAAWLSLDSGDNDPVRFWDYLIAALRTVRPGAGESALALLHSEQPCPVESVLTALINDLVTIPEEFAVVLDDYHLVSADAIHAGLAFLIEHLPPKMHLVVATRAEPPLPLSTFRGRGIMLEIGADDLRFTTEETATLLRDLQDLELSAEDVGAINDRTEGWAVGLTMTAMSIGRQKDAHAFVSRFAGSERHVMEYLTDEVLRRQTDEVREFLLKTSVLDRLTGPLCDRVSGHTDSQAMLGRLEAANMFLIPLDEAGEWYRYHHLFAELLRRQLATILELKQVDELHQNASQWYEDHGFADDAVRHALAARDWERALRLIYAQYEARIKRGEWDTLFNWFQMIPDEHLRTNPRLYSQCANVLITRGSLEAAEAILGNLETASQADASLQGEVAFFQAVIAYRRGDVERMTELLERALERLPEENAAMRARALHILAVFDMGALRLEIAESREAEVLRTAQRIGESWVGGTAASNLGNILLWRGSLRRAAAAARQAIDQSPASSPPRALLARVLYEQNDLDGAARNIRLAIRMSELTGYAESRIGPYHRLAQVSLARGDVAEAEEEMARQDEASRHPTASPLFQASHAALRILFAIQRGDVSSAMRWRSRLTEIPSELWFDYQHVPARLLIAEGDKATAAEQLRGLYEKAVANGTHGYAITVRVCQALAAATPADALTFLAEALAKAEPEGYVRTFVDEGELLAPLLRKAMAQGITPDYTFRLLKIIEAEERARKVKAGEAPKPTGTAGVLSEREIEVLRLLALGLSDRQIARKLTIGLSTAKTHVHRIIEKMNATSRTQAVSRARELKLI